MNTTEEIWKNVPGYEGKYMVSSYGRVKSLSRLLVTNGIFHKSKDRILRTYTNGNNVKVVLCKNNKRKDISLYKIVASAFLETNTKKQYIIHIDGNMLNNHTYNLKYCNEKDYMAWCKKYNVRGNISPNPKKVIQLDSDGNKIKIYQCINKVNEFGYIPELVSLCCRGLRKSHKGYYWKFYEDYKKKDYE